MTGLKDGTPYHDSDTFVVASNRGILKLLFNFEPSFWLWKSMNHQLRKSTNVAQKEHRSVKILVIAASCLIFIVTKAL